MKYFNTHLLSLAGFALITLLLFVPFQSYGKEVTFQWTANPEPLTGYNLYYVAGVDSTLPTEPTERTNLTPIPIPATATTYTATWLLADETYRFALTAYNDTGESGYSEILTVLPDVTVEPAPSPSPTILNIITIQ